MNEEIKIELPEMVEEKLINDSGFMVYLAKDFDIYMPQIQTNPPLSLVEMKLFNYLYCILKIEPKIARVLNVLGQVLQDEAKDKASAKQNEKGDSNE